MSNITTCQRVVIDREGNLSGSAYAATIKMIFRVRLVHSGV
jgi:hypothetical protein